MPPISEPRYMASTNGIGFFPRLDVRKHAALLAAGLLDLNFAGNVTFSPDEVASTGMRGGDLPLAPATTLLSQPRPFWFLLIALRRTLSTVMGTALMRRAEADQASSVILDRHRPAMRVPVRRRVRATIAALLGGRASRSEDIVLGRLTHHYRILDSDRFRPRHHRGAEPRQAGSADLVLDHIITGIGCSTALASPDMPKE
ncbi:MAG: hypothetical protein Q4P33_02620 [Flaviflexus sp.]|nr:hypothetical protein [Flaviflexus sp.]